MKHVSRRISFNCEVCGNDRFEDYVVNGINFYRCTECGRKYSKEELENVNQNKVNANINEMVKEIQINIKKELGKVFRKGN